MLKAGNRRLGNLHGEAQFLAGRHTPRRELLRLFKISREFLHGFWKLRSVGPAVTVFGSARFKEGHPYYAIAREVGKLIAQQGYAVITGGGPGIMEAANRGAHEAGGESIGCKILLPHEQLPNAFLNEQITFKYFFVRKVMLVKYSYAFVIMPGGMGTLDEMTEAYTLIQTGKLYDFPVILVGEEYWRGLLDWLREKVVAEMAMAPEDLKLIQVTDSPEQVAQWIRESGERIGLKLEGLPPTVDSDMRTVSNLLSKPK